MQEQPRALPSAFKPRFSKNRRRWELSTFRVDRASEDEIWDLARSHIESIIGRRTKARCDLPVEEYEAHRLEAEFNNDPPRHVDILGWSHVEEEQLVIANHLCRAVRDRDGFVDVPERVE